MHTYRKCKDENLWTVGYWLFAMSTGNKPEWQALSDHGSELEAIQRVNFLNGGSASFRE